MLKGSWFSPITVDTVYVLNCFSCAQLFLAPWTIARQSPLSMGFSRQEYWSGLPCRPQRDLPDPGIKPEFFMSPALAVGSLPPGYLGSPVDTVINFNFVVINQHFRG